MEEARERFIVGTGRCGSTLLSRMIAEHPRVLSLFEFFTGLHQGDRFGPGEIEGEAFAEIIGREQPFVTAVLRRGYRVEEITYPFSDERAEERADEEPAGDVAEGADRAGGEAGRFHAGDPLPWLLVSVLPRLIDDPDALFDALLVQARGQPRQTRADHYRALFGWLCEQMGRHCWIERSGSSIDYAAALIEEFPDARFVHIRRDGPEVALSMREHHAYRLPIGLIYDVPLASGQRVSELPPLDVERAPDAGDTISRILAARPPAEYFGRYYSDQMQRGTPALAELPESRVLGVRFEELVREPRPILEDIAAFFELGESGEMEASAWLARAEQLIRGVPPTRLEHLPRSEADALIDACAGGMSCPEPRRLAGHRPPPQR